MKQAELNIFIRKYFDLSKCNRKEGHIVHDPKTAPEHRKIVMEICEWAIQNDMKFYTRVFLKNGQIVDIVIPELSRPFIEVRHSELGKEKEYLSDPDLIQFIDTTDPFKLT